MTNEPVQLTPEEIQLKESQEQSLKIDAELERLFLIKKEWLDSELQSESEMLYDIIFDNYNSEEENGISTDFFSLIEEKDPKHPASDDEDLVFILTKKK